MRIPLPDSVHRLLQDEERAGNVIIFGLAGIVTVCFFAALAAMLLLK